MLMVNQTNHIRASSEFLNIHRYLSNSKSEAQREPWLLTFYSYFPFIQTKFKQFLYSGNVVLLELSTSIEFNENVTAACITDEPINSEGETCITVGWPQNEGTISIQFIRFSQLH